MKVDYLYWDSVRIECKNPTKCLTLSSGKIRISLEDGYLAITEISKTGDRDRSILYVNATLVELTPIRAVFKAFWFGGKIGCKPRLTPVKVFAHF